MRAKHTSQIGLQKNLISNFFYEYKLINKTNFIVYKIMLQIIILHLSIVQKLGNMISLVLSQVL